MRNGTVLAIFSLIVIFGLFAFFVPVVPSQYPRTDLTAVGCATNKAANSSFVCPGVFAGPENVEGSITYALFGCGGITAPNLGYLICPRPSFE